jgi:hypothetical protein
MAHKMGIRHLRVFMDSMLVINQINQTYEEKEPSMVKYLQKEKEMMTNFTTCEVFYVPRSQNKKASALSKLASVSFSHLAKETCVEVLQSLATESMELCTVQFSNGSWMEPIHTYLLTGHLPDDRKKAQRIQTQALQYKVEKRNTLSKVFSGVTPMMYRSGLGQIPGERNSRGDMWHSCRSPVSFC